MATYEKIFRVSRRCQIRHRTAVPRWLYEEHFMNVQTVEAPMSKSKSENASNTVKNPNSVNAPRRSASGNAAPALALLMVADGPKDVLSGERPEAASVLEAARRVGPVVRGEVALIRFASATQIHLLIAQQWRGRGYKTRS
jgi:hypothetical protein